MEGKSKLRFRAKADLRNLFDVNRPAESSPNYFGLAHLRCYLFKENVIRTVCDINEFILLMKDRI